MWQYKNTALMYAAMNGYAPIVDALISANADVNAFTKARLICLMTN